jgi:epoxyqueuosine reductase
VDTAPILERDLAQRAGLGWFGKNSMLINPGLGSFFFIGSLFTTLELAADAPFTTDHCGTCTRCMDACPTQAIVAPGVVDAARCVSYLTIEHRGDISPTLRAGVGEHIYGCDVCQDVCPWNEKFARPTTLAAFNPRSGLDSTDARALAIDVLALDESGWRKRFRNSAMKRAKFDGLRRNATVVLANTESR